MSLETCVRLRGRGLDSVFAHTEKDLSSLAGRGTERHARDYPRGM